MIAPDQRLMILAFAYAAAAVAFYVAVARRAPIEQESALLARAAPCEVIEIFPQTHDLAA